jgi:hypothetical protein
MSIINFGAGTKRRCCVYQRQFCLIVRRIVLCMIWPSKSRISSPASSIDAFQMFCFKAPAPDPTFQFADAAPFNLNLAADLALPMYVLRSPNKLQATSFAGVTRLRAALTH